jgi:hypothetical protein
MIRLKWLIYTVLVGLIPIIARLMVYTISARASRSFMWSEADIASFGLVLNIANINALEHETFDPDWKTAVNGFSLLHIVFLGVVFTLSYMRDLQPDIISSRRLTQGASLLSVTSFVLSYTVYHRLSRNGGPATGAA